MMSDFIFEHYVGVAQITIAGVLPLMLVAVLLTRKSGKLQAAAVALRAAIELAQPHAQRTPLVREAIAVASARLAIEEEARRREVEARLTLTRTLTLW